MMRTLALATALVLSLAACGKKDTVAETSSAETAAAAAQQQAKLTPEQLGELGAKIRKSPQDAKQLLARHNLTEESFEAQIREVTENAEASKRYSASYAAATRVNP